MSEIAPEITALFPARPPTLHKGSAGHLLLVAGSAEFPGAALLAARAAARSGVGLVTLAVPASLLPLFGTRVLESVLLPLPERATGGIDPEAAADLLVRRDDDALLLGPGLPADPSTYALLCALAENPGGTLVLDAGALSACARHGGVPASDRPLLLTPHLGEFRALRGDQADDLAAVIASAAEWGVTLVRKSDTTLLAEPGGRSCRLGAPNAALASAGMGDVLAGIIAGLAAQGLNPYDAARLGVAWHAAAGADLAARLGDAGVLASDLIDQLPLTRRRLLGASQ